MGAVTLGTEASGLKRARDDARRKRELAAQYGGGASKGHAPLSTRREEALLRSYDQDIAIYSRALVDPAFAAQFGVTKAEAQEKLVELREMQATARANLAAAANILNKDTGEAVGGKPPSALPTRKTDQTEPPGKKGSQAYTKNGVLMREDRDGNFWKLNKQNNTWYLGTKDKVWKPPAEEAGATSAPPSTAAKFKVPI
jgi:hypothetical protein